MSAEGGAPIFQPCHATSLLVCARPWGRVAHRLAADFLPCTCIAPLRSALESGGWPQRWAAS
eukprot:CAMPEP_0175450158 /NCGR_PEP_ID=MMETSP0095-20121207/62227_1 /TAXON_ID=311494 /ORGANISM="Alexandrium monilatum, Strain CCMP3105" /LENGTH=61 /DNA_ID=CAMNT_0016750625 /DNA_START=35 /DNA_END=216 /DNA_ORIENTATION=-